MIHRMLIPVVTAVALILFPSPFLADAQPSRDTCSESRDWSGNDRYYWVSGVSPGTTITFALYPVPVELTGRSVDTKIAVALDYQPVWVRTILADSSCNATVFDDAGLSAGSYAVLVSDGQTIFGAGSFIIDPPRVQAPTPIPAASAPGQVRASFASGELCVQNESDRWVVPTIHIVGTRQYTVALGGANSRTMPSSPISDTYFATTSTLGYVEGNNQVDVASYASQALAPWTAKCYKTRYQDQVNYAGTSGVRYTITMLTVLDAGIVR
jgi:hypothetical protein